jgi:hypothetical protein
MTYQMHWWVLWRQDIAAIPKLSFGDTVLRYLKKFRYLISLRHCRYHNIFEPLINTVMAASAIEAHFR